jgi:hypothetical protein
MTSADAAELLRKSGGKICVRFYQRPDGTVMTKDCPVGLHAVRQRFARTASALVGSVAFACGAANFFTRPRSEQPALIRWVMDMLSPATMGAPTEPVPPHVIQKRWLDLPVQPRVKGTPAARIPRQAMTGSIRVDADLPTPPPYVVRELTTYQAGKPHTPTSFDEPNNYVLGYVSPAPQTSEDKPEIVAVPDKPYLHGLESEMQPDARPDPFQRHNTRKPARK